MGHKDLPDLTLDELFRDRGRQFWILNISGWLGYTLAAWLGAFAHEKPESYFAVILATALIGFAATIPMRYLYQRLWERPVLVLGAGMLLTSYVFAFGVQWAHNYLYYDWVKKNWHPEHFLDYAGGVLGMFYILLCWSGLYVGIKRWQRET